MRTNVSSFLKKVALGGVLFAATSSPVLAETQGTLGATSTGDFDISLTVNGAVKISNLLDLTLPPFSGADVSGTRTACVYSNSTGGAYNVTATASGASFDLNGTGGSIAYSVTYDDGDGDAADVLSHGATVGMSGASGTDDDCGGSGSNASIQIDVAATAASAVPQGNYSSTLFLLVAPI